MILKNNVFHTASLIILILFTFSTLPAQEMELVWADEFNNSNVDLSVWEYDTGPSNDNLQYYTTRTENVTIIDSVLNIIALEESYNGYDYTSGLIKSKIDWQYGRFEARIKLPATKGFVPAFWMLPADNIYGWWPNSGEIDIMEHPTNEISNIYGSIHTETYNNFGGIGNEGDVTVVADAETAFHVYAVEWNASKIDFYVDDNLYYTFSNDKKGSATWPFDQPFYIILNLAVGGGWVGAPDETTVFPAIMQVDWVRVYQYPKDMQISGAEFVPYNTGPSLYSVPYINDATYSWEVPGNAEINGDQNTHQLSLNWNLFGGDIIARVKANESNFIFSQPVKVTDNLLKNPGFEKGVKYWNSRVGYPADADFILNQADYVEAGQALTIDVQNVTANPWDVQISQREITLSSGQKYNISFWSKSDNAGAGISLTFINDAFHVYHTKTFQLSTEWTQYTFDYTATANDQVSLNIDLGKQTGMVYFDQFVLTTPQLSAMNQIKNGDFINGPQYWDITTLSTAQATASILGGEYLVSISNAGSEPWDIHAGQTPVNIQNSKEYHITFDAYASASRTINVLVGKNSDPWTVYHDPQTFSLTTEKQTFSYSFVMHEASDEQARFGFDIGGNDGYLFFDNIRLSSGTTPVSNIDESTKQPNQLQLSQNYPNPFNPITRIEYDVRAYGNTPQQINLSIYNLLGQKVITIVNKEQAAGHYTVQWDATNFPSGVYIYTLETGSGFKQSRKLVLLK